MFKVAITTFIFLFINSFAYANSKLMMAVKACDISKVSDIIANDLSADINYKDASGNSILHWAATLGIYTTYENCERVFKNIEIFRVVISAKPDLSVVNNLNQTPLNLISSLTFNDLPISGMPRYGTSYALNFYDEVTKALIKPGAYLEIPDQIGRTALIYAAIYGRKELVGSLINAGADLNIQDKDGSTALMHATGKNFKEIAFNLIDSTADLEKKNIEGKTALFYTVGLPSSPSRSQFRLEILNKLISKGANINALDIKGVSPICHILGSFGYIENKDEGVIALLNNGARLDLPCFSETSFVTSSYNGYRPDKFKKDDIQLASIWKELIKAGVRIDSDGLNGYSFLKYSLSIGAEELTKVFVDTGILQNNLGSYVEESCDNKPSDRTLFSYRRYGTLLEWAISNCHWSNYEKGIQRSDDIVSHLIKNEAIVSEDFWKLAIKLDKKMIIRTLIERGNSLPLDILLTAISLNKTDIVQEILDAGANINFVDTKGFAALHYAIWSNNQDIILLLISAKADLNIQSVEGRTPLMEAVIAQHLESVKLLLKAGASTNLRDVNNDTALYLAVKLGNRPIIDEMEKFKN